MQSWVHPPCWQERAVHRGGTGTQESGAESWEKKTVLVSRNLKFEQRAALDLYLDVGQATPGGC
jgi:hypothetical protein